MNILLAEDDYFLANGLTMLMAESGYKVVHTANGIDARHLVLTGSFDLLILDLQLPGLNGLEVLQQIRSKGKTIPVLILTARDTVEDRISGLDLGANDYMAKPFDVGELEARIRALLRTTAWGNQHEVVNGKLRFDTYSRRAFVESNPVDSAFRELSILELLLQNIGRVVTKAQLADCLDDYNADLTNNAIDILIHRLRKKLDSSGCEIRTIRGLGYMVEKVE